MATHHKNHIVTIGNTQISFLEINSMFDAALGGMQINGNADNVTEFIQSLDLINDWYPYGYILRTVLKIEGSKNMTAFLYRLGEKFLN
jgi:hypothetical protein